MTAPVLIEAQGLYDDRALRQTLGLTDATLAKARRSGALRFSRQGKRTLYRGAWVLAWLDAASEPTTERHCEITSQAVAP
jgi:hypothetical protein